MESYRSTVFGKYILVLGMVAEIMLQVVGYAAGSII